MVERIVHFRARDLVRDGFVHFGFHDRAGRQYLIEHQRHFIGQVGRDDRLEWTAGRGPIAEDIPNVRVGLRFPMYVDTLPDGALAVSNFGNARLYRIDLAEHSARVLVDGATHGMADMGNCVVGDDGSVWVNEVTGRRVWRFDPNGTVVDVLGDGSAGSLVRSASFETVRFDWIYDLRRGPDGQIYVLDSRHFAVRVIDAQARTVVTVAGTGAAGYSGDGGDASQATFGSDPRAKFDGPISLSLDEVGNVFVGDRFNHAVRLIERDSGIITTIAGRPDADEKRQNDVRERDPMRLNLPQISSMDYDRGRLFVPTDLAGGGGDLAVLMRS